MILALLVPDALAAGIADCPRTFDTSEIVDAANSAEAGYAKMDADAFATSRLGLEARLACSKDILDRATIARIHRVEVLGAFLDQREARVAQALGGVFAAEPGHQIPSKLVPDGHPIRGLVPNGMTALRDDPGVALPPLRSGWIEVDGGAALLAPTQRAALLQQIDGQGAVLATHYRWPEDLGFDWLVAEEPARLAASDPTLSPSLRTRAGPLPWTRRAPLIALTVGSLAATGALIALAVDTRAEFDAAPTLGANATDRERGDYRGELETMQTRALGLTVGYCAAAGGGLVLGVVTVATW
jgi:hypothetical protein